MILSAFPVRVPLSYYHHGYILWCMQYVHTLQLACFARTSHPLCLLDADAKWSYCRYLRYRLPSHVDLRCDPTSRVNCWYVVSLSLPQSLSLPAASLKIFPVTSQNRLIAHSGTRLNPPPPPPPAARKHT